MKPPMQASAQQARSPQHAAALILADEDVQYRVPPQDPSHAEAAQSSQSDNRRDDCKREADEKGAAEAPNFESIAHTRWLVQKRLVPLSEGCGSTAEPAPEGYQRHEGESD